MALVACRTIRTTTTTAAIIHDDILIASMMLEELAIASRECKAILYRYLADRRGVLLGQKEVNRRGTRQRAIEKTVKECADRVIIRTAQIQSQRMPSLR